MIEAPNGMTRSMKGLSSQGPERGDASTVSVAVSIAVLDCNDPLESSGIADARPMLDSSSSRLRLSAIVVA